MEISKGDSKSRPIIKFSPLFKTTFATYRTTEWSPSEVSSFDKSKKLNTLFPLEKFLGPKLPFVVKQLIENA